jgi:hypothetical protein
MGKNGREVVFPTLASKAGSGSAACLDYCNGRSETTMIETESASAGAKDDCIVFALADVDIEGICRKYSEEAHPPEVFLVNSKSIGNALLAVSLEFLEQGQLLPCPGLPLVGAAFDPDWGFASAVIDLNRNGSADFRLPPGPFDIEGERNTYGYRLCPIDNHETPAAIQQLAHIRAELAKPRQQSGKTPGIKVMVTQL